MTKKPSPPLWAVNQRTAAHLIGKPARWLRDSSAPRLSDGSYDPRELVAWMVAELTSGDDLEIDKLRGQIKVLKERIRRYRRYESDIVIPVAETRDRLTFAVDRLQKLSDQFEELPEVTGRTAQEMLNQAIETSLLEIKTELAQCCLLYTSPSPRDQRGSRMPSSA